MHRSIARLVRLDIYVPRRQFYRNKSYYLSEKWLKEPFDIGYPESSSHIKEDSKLLRQKLFPTKTLTEYDYFKQDSNREFRIEEWNQLDTDQMFKYQEMVDDAKPQYVHPKPQYVTGFELFKIELQFNRNEKKYWAMLDGNDREAYNDSEIVRHLYNERIRIWMGYEIVEYLKRNLPKYMFNPYPLLGLYPWEIIKDKLYFKRDVYDFEKDYYDTLIKETFGRNSQRKALQIYYTDILHDTETDNLYYAKVEKMFNSLPPYKKQYYVEKERKRQEHAKKTRLRSYKQKTPYLKFLIQFSKTYNPTYEELNAFDANVSDNNIRKLAISKAAGREWKNLTEEQKKQYESDGTLSSNTRLYKEMILDWKVEMVMDYIYEVGGVSGLQSSHNWRKDMHEKTSGYRYLKKMYVDKLVYLQNGNVVVSKD
ncbi:uncharacterized protein AC631_01728 [Debaryomyces fabryi]|uniref:HMG box domain-containing protein n=1 Tax=Debaryomyces fabryi TaxID=58627 RepID=A0A0V1Q250_9ASCO|nr:uncharacterized protein AC631_01728 [Debaryomyces fabryi]KSA02553.1 hypothetical protein AC631_01728 [Debaryomyces fabryi]CUM47683.1 unnamed protein product [Debaryomyces fabryi]